MPRMYGKNVVLREMRWEDLPDVRAWMMDAATTDMLSDRFNRPQTWEQTEKYLRDLVEGNMNGAYFAIAEPEKLRYMGEISLTGIDNIARKARLTVLLKPDCTGRGYGTEAVRLVLKFAFNCLNLERVALSVLANNARAIRLYEKVGFVHEGVLRRETYRNGEYIDVVQMGILRGEYRETEE